MNPDDRYRPPYPSKSPTPTRETEATGTSRTHIYLDDETLHRMIESFGPIEYSQFAATVSSPEGFANLSDQDPWQLEQQWSGQESTSRRKSRSPRDASYNTDQNYLLSQSQISEESNIQAAEAQHESLIEWFDRSVEKELRKRRDSGGPSTSPLDPAMAPLKAKHALNLSKGTAERMAETSASRVEIAARLETDFTTELTDAVEKFAKAESMSHYAEALQAAEEAAQNAPPELMEQAAAAEARRIQTQLSKVKETIPGVRPIEVVGYVGITKPYHPKKPH
ncbi:uncharacterized protein LOC123005491 [Tribolium madens]|uniref:uncharacterized protein LOC123005491 n=1 Tax=Tribolium madens TaxID=41895 RepID=UPI001CF7249B|nr:uncharacterized protein LOC123005491 [Tribolium madens]